LLFGSISTGKLLPYQDYLLYRPCGSVRAKAYFQQKSDGDVGNNSCIEESDMPLVSSDMSCVQPTSAEILEVFENTTKSGVESMLQSLPDTEPVDHHVVGISSDLPDQSASAAAGDTQLPPSQILSIDNVNDVAEIPTSHTDYEQMSAENRKRVSEFFSHSRLHHISTWGAEYKAYVTQLQAQVSEVFSWMV